jgi:hypothetical protein
MPGPSGAEARYGIPFAILTDTPDMEALSKAVAENVAGINMGQGDFMQAGVLATTDWSLTAAVNAATGELSSTGTTGGTAWLTDPVVAGALMRSVAVPAKLEKLKPPSLPAAGKFMSVGVQLTPSKWGAAPSVSIVSGVEKTTLAEAEAAPAGAVAGKLRIRDVVIKNTAGVYSIEAQRDRRPWAKGALAAVRKRYAEGENPSNVVVAYAAMTALNQRVECSGAPVEVTFHATAYNESGAGIGSNFWVDGALLEEANNQLGVLVTGTKAIPGSIGFRAVIEPGAGSHLFQPVFEPRSTGTAVISNGNTTSFVVRELLGTANNGTT